MARPGSPSKFRTKEVAASVALTEQDIKGYGRFVAITAAQTITLPTPSLDLDGWECLFVNNSTGNLTLASASGFARSGSSLVLATTTAVMLHCGWDGGTGYIWDVVKGAAGAAGTAFTQTGTGVVHVSSAVIAGAATLVVAADVSPTTPIMIAYNKTALTGGTASALDGIAYADLANGDRARVVVGNAPGVIYDYVFDSGSGVVELSPGTIKPDDGGAGAGRWILATIAGASLVYGTAANTACVGNDGRLPTAAEKTAIGAVVGSADWTTWTPTIASVPAVDTSVARYRRVGNMIEFTLDVRGADGDTWTPSTITGLPVAPRDTNTLIPLNCQQKVDTTWSNPLAYIDAETNLRIQFHAASVCTNNLAWIILISGSYEVAA